MKKHPLALAFIACLCVAAPALADFSLCNRTEHEASVAIAFRKDNMWTSVGWWVLEPGVCETLVMGTLLKSSYFVHAIHHDVGGSWQGAEPFCVDKGSFTVKGRENCEERGLMTREFFEVETNSATNWSLDLLPMADLPPQETKLNKEMTD